MGYVQSKSVKSIRSLSAFCLNLLIFCFLTGNGFATENLATNTLLTLWQRDTLTGDWGGPRSSLSEKGFDFELEYTGEFLANTHGGVRRGELYQGSLKTLLDFDLQKMTGWKGARFHVSSLWLRGTERNDIAGLTGSVYSDPSNISGYDTYRLFELWLEQDFFDGTFSARFGQLALDEEFVVNDYSGVFISGTHGWPTFLASTLPSGGNAYPVTGTGIRFSFKASDRLEILAAVMDGDVHDQATDNREGTHFGFHEKEGLFSIVELAFRLNQEADDKGLPGTYKFGVWYHSGRFDDLRRDNHGVSLEDDGTLSGVASTGVPASHVGNGGIYLDIGQMVWRKQPDSDEGVGLYARVAPWLPDDRNPLNLYAAGGVNVKGLLPGRSQDVFGLGINYTHISGSLRGIQGDANHIASAGGTPNNLSPGPLPDYEMTIEATYQINIAPWWSMQPDFQYIIHPGGSSATKDAVLLGLRTKIAF